MPLERFLQMLYNQENVLVRPFSWNDPYESLIKNSEIEGREGRKYPFDESRWYGQCWSESPESDALWQVFTKSTIARGVKLKTTSRILKESLSEEERKDDRVFFLERVNYSKRSEEETTIESLIRTYSFDWGYEADYNTLIFQEQFKNDPNIMAAPILLTKRNAFQHEQEVRLLCYYKEEQTEKLYGYKIPNWCNFIEEVELDPWCPNGVDNALNDILEKYNIRKSDGSLLKSSISDLYQKCKAHVVYKSDYNQ